MIHHKFKASGKTFIVIIIFLIFFCFSIVGCSQTEHINGLIQKLKDENSEVRYKAAAALGSIGDNRAVEPLIEVLGDEDWYVLK